MGSDRVGAHQCRRYIATTQLAMGRSPLDVQRQMGHTTLTMTNHYASLTVQHLQKSHEKYSLMRAEKADRKRYLVRAIGMSRIDADAVYRICIGINVSFALYKFVYLSILILR